MPRNACLLLQLLTYGMLIGISYALMGKTVRTVRENEYSYVVAIAKRDSRNQYGILCTGILIRPKLVLTAAHCLQNKSIHNTEILAGARMWYDCKKFYPHSWLTYDEWKYNTRNDKPSINNIAIIQIEGSGATGPNNRVIPLARLSRGIVLDNRDLSIAGWGFSDGINTRSMILRQGTVKVLSQEECNEKATALKGKTFTMHQNYFCSQRNPSLLSTPGDAGGPLVTHRNRDLVGINIGVLPVIKDSNYTEDYLHEHLMNSHLRLDPYNDFIEHALSVQDN